MGSPTDGGYLSTANVSDAILDDTGAAIDDGSSWGCGHATIGATGDGSSSGTYSGSMFSPQGPSALELLIQALSRASDE